MVARQYDICANLDRATKARSPYFIVLQTDLLDIISTAVAAPLRKGQPPSAVARLNPVVQVAGETFTVSMQEMAAIYRNRLGPIAGSAAGQHPEFVVAVDLMFTRMSCYDKI